MLRVEKRVIEIGNSLGITFDSVIVNTLKLKKGDKVMIQIEKK